MRPALPSPVKEEGSRDRPQGYRREAAPRGEQPGGLAFELEPRVLVRLVARERGDALNEIEDRRGRVPLFVKHGGDDPVGLAFRQPRLPQERQPTFIATPAHLPPSGLDPAPEGRGRGPAPLPHCRPPRASQLARA